ncbi:MAG TPA: CocE/NonD family hydrolase [Thermoanaerobaculia bacterium]|nr:CocE/NonD family hydrolase [Thermoanaerobaculia bacterium]
MAARRISTALAAALLGSIVALPVAAQHRKEPATYPALPSEIPATFERPPDSLEYERRIVDIPARDGVTLHTVIFVPKGAKNAPILLTRTPYDAERIPSDSPSAHLALMLRAFDDIVVEGGYIRVVQDVRGKHGSQGDYVMNRPPRGPQNPTPVDHATDTYDTIEWLIRNVPETNGRVGITGVSYPGFLSLMPLTDPHPALRVAVPMNPMVDGWMGDDWFHYGAFRQFTLPFVHAQQATRKSTVKWVTEDFDEYDTFMRAGSAGELARRRGLEQTGFWRKIVEHPTYDAFWQDQAVDRILARHPLKVPVMLVHSFWDQEDIYGAIAVYEAIEPKDTRNDMVYLVSGPWYHGQQTREGSSLGAIRFDADTSLWFRRNVLRPFLDYYLKEDAPKHDVAPVTMFETGTNRWQRLESWPSGCPAACAPRLTPLYLREGMRAGFTAPAGSDAKFAEYVSDPAKPVPYIARPIYADGRAWRTWLTSDQREASGRTDVLTFVSEVLAAPVKIAGRPVANLVASTSGSDSDWVVKLIDVYPPEVAAQPEMGGYQLMVAGDIFRGRYRESFESPKALASNEPLLYRFALPTANHVFLPGHRIMVQVQSSWFPLYDRNPQTFVPSIFFAKPDDYVKATQRVWHAPGNASFVELPVVEGP